MISVYFTHKIKMFCRPRRLPMLRRNQYLITSVRNNNIYNVSEALNEGADWISLII